MWLLPENQEYGQWPSSGEIDLMESRGNRDLTLNGANIGVEQVSHTLHYGIDYLMNGFENAHFESQRAAPDSWNMDFHVYKVNPFQISFHSDYHCLLPWTSSLNGLRILLRGTLTTSKLDASTLVTVDSGILANLKPNILG